MPPPPTSFFRARALVVAAALLGMTLMPVSPAQGAAPWYTMEERAFAIASPSLVYLENRLSGFVRKTETGTALHATPVSLTYRCTGFVVESQGHVVTTNHCIQPAQNSMVFNALNLVADELVKGGQLLRDAKSAYIEANQAGAEFAGELAGSGPAQVITGQLFQGQSDLSTEPAVQGEFLDFLPTDGGDVALLRFPLAGMPSVELAADSPQVTEPVVLAAFGRNDGSAIYTPRSVTARISGRIGTDAPAIYQLDSDLGGFSHGGVVVDSSGRVIGMITADIPNPANRVVGSVEWIQRVLSKAGVTNALSPIDAAYRDGLNDYFGGRYSGAIDKLDNVLAVMPDHVLASHYRKQASERFAIEGDRTDGASSKIWVWTTIVLGVMQVISIALIGWLLLRRRSMVGFYQPVSALPVSAYPISAAPVSEGHMLVGYQPITSLSDPPPVAPEAELRDQGRDAGTDGDSPWAQRQ